MILNEETLIEETAQSGPGGSRLSAWSSFAIILNLLFGFAFSAIPMAFSKAGFFLSYVTLCGTSLLAFVSCTFVLETLGVCNALENNVALQTSGTVRTSKNVFALRTRFEYTWMADVIFGRIAKYIVAFTVSTYLFAWTFAIIVQGCYNLVALDQELFSSTPFGLLIIGVYITGIIVLIGYFSTRTLPSTKLLQSISAIIKISILLVIIGTAIYHMVAVEINIESLLTFEPQHLPGLYLFFMLLIILQPVIPAIAVPVYGESQIKFSFVLGLGVFLVSQLVTSVLSLVSFVQVCKTCTTFLDILFRAGYHFTLGALNVYNILEIFSVPVLTIVLRDNLLTVLFPNIKNNDEVQPKYKVLITILPFVTAILAGITMQGNFILFFIRINQIAFPFVSFLFPAAAVWRARILKERYFPDFVNTYQSPLRHPLWPPLILLAGVLYLICTFYS